MRASSTKIKMTELVLNITYKYVPTEMEQHHLTLNVLLITGHVTLLKDIKLSSHMKASHFGHQYSLTFIILLLTRTLSVSKTDENVTFSRRKLRC